MAKLSTIEIAAKQRHMLLLGKVKENKALTRAELGELKRYERQAAAKIIAKAKMPAKPRVIKKKPKGAPPAGPGKKNAKKGKKAKKKRRARPPVDVAEVRRLGLESENLTAADAAIKTRRSMADLFKKYPEIKAAWDHGRFLRNLRDMTRAGLTISRMAKNLGFDNGQALRAMINEDVEVGDLWKQTRNEVEIEVNSQILEAAKEANPAAIRVYENFLRDEKEHTGFDPYHMKTSQLTEFTDENKQRISEWHNKFELPRNPDEKTYHLGVFLAWYKEFLLKKVSESKGPAAELDPLRAARAEMIKVELARRRNELLDRNEVVISQIAWVQNIKAFCERSNDELSKLCCNQPREKIAEIHRRFFRELLAESAKYPKEFCLPADLERQLVEILQKLKPHEDKGENTRDT